MGLIYETAFAPTAQVRGVKTVREQSRLAKHWIPACLLMCMSVTAAPLAHAQMVWGGWASWGDQGDGSYRNPIAPADYSDVDAIRVGEDYYAISSTIHVSPGMAVMHSRDLVNWRTIGHVVPDLTALGPRYAWDQPATPGRGIWAGTIRHHAGRFWVFFGTPDEGYFMSSATNPAGPWTAPHPVLSEAGWDDPAVLWDDDGKAYFLGTHFSDGYKSYLWPMSADGRTIDRDRGVLVNQGAGREASKLLKIGGYYYLMYSEVGGQGGERGRSVFAKRARAPMGPYGEGRQLAEVGRDAYEPNQGGLVQAPGGNWYFLTHHGRQDWEGRAMSLLPVTWIDGWPILGTPRQSGIGAMAWSGMKPVPGEKLAPRRIADEFSRAALGPDWEWTRNPRPGSWSLTERRGWMRLHAWRPAKPSDPLSAGNILTQRAWRTAGAAMTVKLDLGGMADGQHAGLGHFSNSYGMLGAYRRDGVRRLEYRHSGSPPQLGPALKGRSLWLRMAWGLSGETRFAYSLDGRRFVAFGDATQQARASYRGSRVGIISYNDEREAGYVDLDRVDYDYSR